MILGLWDERRGEADLMNEVARALTGWSGGRAAAPPQVWTRAHLAMGYVPSGIETLDEQPQPFHGRTSTAVVVGKLYNRSEIRRSLGRDHEFRTSGSCEALVHLYERKGERFLEGVNGKFSFALWDDPGQCLLLGRDHFGIESLYYSRERGRLVFGSSLRALVQSGLVSKELNHAAVLQYLLYCYNPGEQTLVKGLERVPPGHVLRFTEKGVEGRRYWYLSFAEQEEKPEEAYREEIPDLIEDAIRLRVEDQPPGVLLSGGTDSSTIVSLAARMFREPIQTFSFRCEGRSYDESRYARRVAQQYATHHTEIPYAADSLPLIARAAGFMDEPFCDIGIEIGTFLLGQSAEGKVSYLLSGEGGDELFAGHPVYTADKLARFVDRVPRVVLRPVARLLSGLPDSEEKKNLQVKLKRFAYSMAFPPELLSHRWRAYYSPVELRRVCTRGFLEHADLTTVYDTIRDRNAEADGPDHLSRSLYSDYYTLVSFYLRRLGLLQAFSIESRLPLLDYRLVEYAAKIPSRLKLKGMSETKYIYRRALERVLPREILYDRPKLGHSVPMKNWIREDRKLKEWVGDLLGESSLKKRGLFRGETVGKMLREHESRRENHSHRLWGLLVLELWMQSWLDSA